MKQHSSRTLNLEFTSLEFFPEYVVSTIKEDTIFEEQHVNKLIEICISHFKESSFVYIANRKFNYNVNPLIYLKLSKVDTLKGIAITSDRISSLKTANFEKHFSPVPVELFENMDEARSWSRGLIKE